MSAAEVELISAGEEPTSAEVELTSAEVTSAGGI